MTDRDYRTVLMGAGDFILLPPDENGIVRHATIDGNLARGQRLANRLYAIRGESPFDPTMGLPLLDLSIIESDSIFASFAAEALRHDDEVQSIRRVEVHEQTQEQLENAERDITITVAFKDGSNTSVATRV